MDRCPPSFNLAEYVLHHSGADDGKIALALLMPTGSQRWSYGKLRGAVAHVARGLSAAGLAPGDRLLLRLGNGIAFPIAFLAAVSAGIIPVPTATALTQSELDAMLEGLAPRAIAASPDVALPSRSETLITEGEISALAARPLSDVKPLYARGDPERLAYIIFTSGTSGRARAVAHAHRAIWARRMMFEAWYGLTPEDRLMHAGAMNWTFTLGTGLLDPWAMGATALIPAPEAGLGALPMLMRRHDATLFAAAPGVLRKLLKDPVKLTLPKLRHTLTAGEHLQDPLKMAWENATGRPLYEAYGMTECSTFLSASPAGAAALTPQPGRKIDLLEDGTIAIHKDEQGLMLGYLDAGLAPHLPLEGNWFLTNDQATRGAQGAFTYQGRRGEMLNAGGFRISPLEVERVLAGHPGLEEAAVCELPIDGSTILAACYTAPKPLDRESLDAYVSARLARYKHPRAYRHVSALPRSPNGKLLRRDLPAVFAAKPETP
ncbi:MAG: class I adenylate-forming enzyme family protein [Pseudomonadota bacterium]